MTQIVMPTHTNHIGGVLFGGALVQWIDVCAAVAAMRHCGGTAVTASIDRLDFLVPIHVGDVVVLQAQVNYAARTSMEVGCRVETEDPRTGERRYTTKAYLTFVALDENGRPRLVPAVAPVGREEKRRFADAARRREERLLAAGKSVSRPPEPEASGARAPKGARGRREPDGAPSAKGGPSSRSPRRPPRSRAGSPRPPGTASG